VNYTREPIIETVITPKEGCKLVIRNSKGVGQEEYFVEALEVITFGNAIFFRSTERPKSFLVPASDYEVIELRETKMVLKSTNIEKAIKIGGGKIEPDNKPSRRKRSKKPKQQRHTEEKPPTVETEKGGAPDDETQVSSSILRKLFPPPPNLIKEKFNHNKSPEKIDENISKEIVKEEKTPKPEKKTEIEEQTEIVVEEKISDDSEPKEEEGKKEE